MFDKYSTNPSKLYLRTYVLRKLFDWIKFPFSSSRASPEWTTVVNKSVEARSEASQNFQPSLKLNRQVVKKLRFSQFNYPPGKRNWEWQLWGWLVGLWSMKARLPHKTIMWPSLARSLGVKKSRLKRLKKSARYKVTRKLNKYFVKLPL